MTQMTYTAPMDVNDDPLVIAVRAACADLPFVTAERVRALVPDPWLAHPRRFAGVARAAGLVAVPNPGDRAGRWRVGTRRVVIYARTGYAPAETLAAIRARLVELG